MYDQCVTEYRSIRGMYWLEAFKNRSRSGRSDVAHAHLRAEEPMPYSKRKNQAPGRVTSTRACAELAGLSGDILGMAGWLCGTTEPSKTMQSVTKKI